MIRRVRIYYHKTSVWSRGEIYTDKTGFREGELIFDKTYPDVSSKDIWADIRRESVKRFFDIFYADVVDRTKHPEPHYRLGEDPKDVIERQSKYIQKRITQFPELYEWSMYHKKWIMKYSGYVDRTITLGRGLDIAIGIHPEDIELKREMRGEEMFYGDAGRNMIDYIQATRKYEKISLIIFVYPDKYDEEIRAIFELVIDFV